MLNKNSLSLTIDALNEAFFTGIILLPKEKENIAHWLAEQQGKPGSYAGMFAPTDYDFRGGTRMFTGEELNSKASISHILGEEACRALILLNVRDFRVQEALANATAGMMERLGPPSGIYCCGKCTVSMLRHTAAGGLSNQESRLSEGLKALKEYRDGKGKWRRFPFFYTLLMLTEIEHPQAVSEMKYAAPVCERYLRRNYSDTYGQRRRSLCERVLEKC